jgi:hypothetical protein
VRWLRKISAVLLPTAALLAGTPSARAQDTTAPADAWTFRIMPYLWAAGISGEGTGGRGLPTFDIDKGFDDVIGDLDFAFMGSFEAQRGRFGLIADVIYLDVSSSASTPFGLIFSKVHANLSSFVGTAYGGYRFFETERAGFDVLAGARLFSLDLDLDFEAGRFGRDRSFDSSSTWADPVIGVRGRIEVGDGFFVNAAADVGGFGLSSDITWQALGTVGYSFNENWEVRAGYRYLAVDYPYLGERSIDLDVAFSGPIIGVGYRW